MRERVELQTSSLTDSALGWAAGEAAGLEMWIKPGQYLNPPSLFAKIAGRDTRWQPEQQPDQAWPLLVALDKKLRLHLDFQCNGASYLEAGIRCGHTANDMLTAALRALVSAKTGPRVSIPAELLPPFNTYTTNPGESLLGIALRELNAGRLWTEIRDLNASRFPDMGPHDYYPPGTTITLPEGGAL